jgi:integrase
MPGRQAKVFTTNTLRIMLRAARRSRTPERDRVILLLSAFAGLRACEIARLEWSMVTAGDGRIAASIEIPNGIAKYGSGRRIPLHQDLKRALLSLSLVSDAVGPVVKSRRGGALRANSIVNWYLAEARACGLEGCSSHSGRRTFITNTARKAHHAGASLRDVQLLAGHRSIETTQGYIDGNTDAQRRLVQSLRP